MYDKLIKKHLEANSVNEESVPGVKTTDATKKDEAKVNKDYYKDVEKKMSDYNAASTKKDKDGIDAPKNKLSKKEEEIMQDIEMGGGMQDLTYHNEPDERFKERQEMAIKGDSKMGNKIYTGKENGNTESTWGASDDELGEKIIKRTKRRQEKIDAAADNLTSFGDDIEFNPNKKSKKSNIAVENTENNNNKLTETTKMKRLRFKSAFNGMENALNLIPEGYKEDNKVFEMTDGNESYKVRWEGNLTEGKAVVLQAANQEVIKEDMNKIFHLMNYSSEKTLGTVKGKDRIQENTKFSEIWDKAKRIIKEDKENTENNDSTIEEGFFDLFKEKSKYYKLSKKETFNGGKRYNFKTKSYDDRTAIHHQISPELSTLSITVFDDNLCVMSFNGKKNKFENINDALNYADKTYDEAYKKVVNKLKSYDTENKENTENI